MIDRTYRVNDVVKSEFLRLPLALLANPKYKQMSLEAKFIYSLLLNRMTLSQRNDWINEDNEVYLIYTREEAANTLNISYKKSIAAFKELIQNGLLYEHRQGLGAPNLLYVLKADLTDEDAKEFGESFDGNDDENGEKESANPVNMQTCQNGISRHAEMTHQDMPKSHIKNCQNGTSKTADTEVQDMPKRHTKKIDNKKTEISYIENSQSINQSSANFGRIVSPIMTDGQTDDEEKIQDIVKAFNDMGLHTFTPQGAFYVFPCIKSTGMTSEQFCEELLKDQLVACVPGTAFGEAGEGYIRVSYAYSIDQIKEATTRIKMFLDKLND